jgi:hypothetical protein
LPVTVVIRVFLSCGTRNRHARRSAGRLNVNASGDWGNEHPGESQKQRRRPDR